jgi:pimeloyl-ACP methyl ester carboxylesterase
MPFFDADDAAIYYEIEGDGPPLVLLHGYALNGMMWEYQAPAFSKSHKVITVDLRGFGRSSCGQVWSGAIMASDVIGLMSSLNLDNVAVLGFSMGGPVAVRIAYLLPEVVTKLILVSSILPSRGLPRTKEEERRNRKELEILKSRGVDGWAESMGMWRGPLVGDMLKDNPQLESMWRKLISRHDINYLTCMMTARLTTESGTDWRSRLKKIQQKTLIIAGADDRNFIDASNRLAQDIPNSEMVILEGAGHMVNLEKPEEFNRAVLGFLDMEKN